MRFGARSEHGCFKIVGGSGVGVEAVMQRHACESEFGREGEVRFSGRESSWLCMKCLFE
jgi:hypothetical protein